MSFHKAEAFVQHVEDEGDKTAYGKPEGKQFMTHKSKELHHNKME